MTQKNPPKQELHSVQDRSTDCYDWRKNHSLCLEQGINSPDKKDMLKEILKGNHFVFVVLVFAKLEFLIKKLIASGFRDVMLFDINSFERNCD